jgi:hypothetical protein
MWENDESANQEGEDSPAGTGTGSSRSAGGNRGPSRSDNSAMGAALVYASQIGFSIACPMVVFIGGGAWLDNRLGWGPWLLLVGVILGIASAGALFYQIAKIPASRSRKTGLDVHGAPYKVEEPRKPNMPDLGNPPTDKIDGNGH